MRFNENSIFQYVYSLKKCLQIIKFYKITSNSLIFNQYLKFSKKEIIKNEISIEKKKQSEMRLNMEINVI